ncbi:integrase/recombinase XerD [Bradyrhizobium diazoefficiens]
MLRDDADRYISLRRTLGYKLVKAERHLRAFAHFAAGRGEAHIRSTSVLAWLATVARTSGARERRLTDLILFARFLHAEDPRHDIPRADFARSRQTRPIPYIYTADEIARILDAAGRLRQQKPNPLRHQLYVMLFGLIAATGLRVSEAIALKLDDIGPDSVLHVRETKFRKSRLVPLHPTVIEALGRYLEARRQHAGASDWLFPSVRHRALCPTTVNYTFRCVLRELRRSEASSLASTIFAIPSQLACSNNAASSVARSPGTSSLCRPISAMSTSGTPIGISRRRRR